MQSLVYLTTFVLYVNAYLCTCIYEESRRCLQASEDSSGKHGSARRLEDMRVRKPGGSQRPRKAAVGNMAAPGGLKTCACGSRAVPGGLRKLLWAA